MTVGRWEFTDAQRTRSDVTVRRGQRRLIVRWSLGAASCSVASWAAWHDVGPDLPAAALVALGGLAFVLFGSVSDAFEGMAAEVGIPDPRRVRRSVGSHLVDQAIFFAFAVAGMLGLRAIVFGDLFWSGLVVLAPPVLVWWSSRPKPGSTVR